MKVQETSRAYLQFYKNPARTWIKKQGRYIGRNYQLYILLTLIMAYYFIFAYLPIFGLRMAFMDFNPVSGFAGSKWVGFENFQRLFQGAYFWPVLRNTIFISLYGLLAGFPFPIVFALAVNLLQRERVKKVVQTVAFAPHFISTVVIVGMLKLFLSPSTGIVNLMLEVLGAERINFMGQANLFPSVYVWSGIWQNTGWNAVIYIAALSGIDPQLHEAATIDGASRLKRIWHIDLPGIMPTIIILTIMSCANLLGIGFEKIYLMQNDLNLSTSEVISTYSYKIAFDQADYSYSAAVSMFNSVVTFTLLVIVNAISKKISDTSLW